MISVSSVDSWQTYQLKSTQYFIIKKSPTLKIRYDPRIFSSSFTECIMNSILTSLSGMQMLQGIAWAMVKRSTSEQSLHFWEIWIFSAILEKKREGRTVLFWAERGVASQLRFDTPSPLYSCWIWKLHGLRWLQVKNKRYLLEVGIFIKYHF